MAAYHGDTMSSPSTPSTVTQHLRITGHVQGVGYRYHMAQESCRLGVAGWVRNCSDGSVEAVLHGAPSAVQAVIEWARQGSALARVEALAVADAAWDGDTGTGFAQRETV